MRRALALVMILLVLTIVPAAKAEGRPDLWAKTYGGGNDDWAYAVAIAPNGDIIVAGWTVSFGAGYKDVWVLRLDENGELPYSDMVKDSSAEVEATNADIGNKNAEIETPDVVVKSTDVNPRDSNANIETQYSKYDQALKAIKTPRASSRIQKPLDRQRPPLKKEITLQPTSSL